MFQSLLTNKCSYDIMILANRCSCTFLNSLCKDIQAMPIAGEFKCCNDLSAVVFVCKCDDICV